MATYSDVIFIISMNPARISATADISRMGYFKLGYAWLACGIRIPGLRNISLAGILSAEEQQNIAILSCLIENFIVLV